MKQFLSFFLILLSLSACSKKDDKSFLENVLLLFVRKDRVTLSGAAVKGVIKNADVNVHKVNSDGTCNTKSILGTTTTDENGNYSVLFNKGNGIVCVRVQPSTDGLSKMYDEKTKSDIAIAPNSDFVLTNIFPEDKLAGSARSNNAISPFSRMISNRFANLMASSKGSISPSELNKKASKEVVIRFGLNAGLSSSSSNTRNIGLAKNSTGVIDGDNFPELSDLNIDFKNLENPLTAKYVAILAGFSQLATQYKKGSAVSVSDVDSVIESFAKDFADGVFDGKDATGAQIFIGTGSSQVAMPANSITAALLPAVSTFFAQGGSLSIGQNSTSTNSQRPPINVNITAINQIQFNDTAPINISVVGGTVATATPSFNSIRLNWSGQPNITSYKVYRKFSAGVTTTDTEITAGGTPNLTITENGVPGGTQRFYKVSYTINGQEVLSDEVSSTAFSSPIDVLPTDMVVWFKADTFNLPNGASVNVGANPWINLSPSGPTNSLNTVAGGGSLPTFLTNQINGLPVIRFVQGNDSGMERTSGLVGNITTAGHFKNIFYVLKKSVSTAGNLFIIGRGDGMPGGWKISIPSSNIFDSAYSAVVAYSPTSSALTQDINIVYMNYQHTTSTNSDFYFNGTFNASALNNSPITTASMNDRFSINAVAGQAAGFDLAEVVYYAGTTQFSPAQRERIQCYLSRRYNIAVSHPCTIP
jgi:hypothetical protein